jgi:hypothetical protein
MDRKNRISTESENGNLVPDEDFEYEQKAAAEEQARRQAYEQRREELARERAQHEREEREERDRKIAQDKIELMKLKTGVIDESDEIKEEHTEKRVLKGKERIANIWYHDKVWICFGAFIFAIVAFMVIDVVTREKADLTVMLIADNGLTLHTDELEEFFEQYTPDLNGDGKVHVSIMNVALNNESTDTVYSTNSSKFLANLQQGRIIMVITDSNTDPDYQELMVDDLPEQFPDNPYVDEQGLSLNFGFLADELNYSDMTNDIHLCLRRPLSTLDDSLELMQEYYDESFDIFSAMAEGLKEQADELGDKGLPAPESSADTSSVADTDSKSEQDVSETSENSAA